MKRKIISIIITLFFLSLLYYIVIKENEEEVKNQNFSMIEVQWGMQWLQKSEIYNKELLMELAEVLQEAEFEECGNMSEAFLDNNELTYKITIYGQEQNPIYNVKIVKVNNPLVISFNNKFYSSEDIKLNRVCNKIIDEAYEINESKEIVPL